jgi:glycosyltransferase involved in cell wall biosynthesis
VSAPADAVDASGHPGWDRAGRAGGRSPRVAVDARLVRASGIGTYLQNLLPLITAARPRWHFDLLGRPDELGSFPWAQTSNVSIIACDAPIYGLREQIQLARRIPPATDLVWSPHYNIPLGYRGQLLVTIHDLCHLALPQLVAGVHRRAYARFMFAAVRRRASGIICVSEFTRRELRRLSGSAKRTPIAIHHGVNPRWFEIQPEASPHPRPFILAVGNIKPHKNLATLIKAFSLAAGSIQQDLVIVGRQEGLITADRTVNAAVPALGGRVRLTGEVDQHTLEQFFAHADALVFPSLYEGFGMPALEAMACGCPAIVSNAGSLPEVCGDAAVYFDPLDPEELADSITRVLSRNDLRLDLRERGRRHAAQFQWNRCAVRTLGLLEELVPA